MPATKADLERARELLLCLGLSREDHRDGFIAEALAERERAVWREVLALAESSGVSASDVDALTIVAQGYGPPAGNRAQALAWILRTATARTTDGGGDGE